MAGIEINTLLISTYARFIISENTAIAESVALLSLPVEQLKRIASGDEQLHVQDALDPQSIAIALASPAKHIILDGFHALAKVLQTRLEKHLGEEEIFARDINLSNPNDIPKKVLEKATVVECESLLGKIDNHCGETFDKYQEILHNCTQEVIDAIQANIVPLSDLETHELLFQESIADLNKRMIDLSITWPKLNYKDFNVSDYIALKSYIAVYSAYARGQQATDDKTMQKAFKQILKLIKNTDINNKMKELINESQANYKTWTDAFPAVAMS